MINDNENQNSNSWIFTKRSKEILMSLPSKFPDHNCKSCKIMIKKGDPVNRIDATGKWCSNPKCPTSITESVVQESMEQPKPEPKPEINTSIEVKDPFQEAELITRWASDRAYKITMAEVYDFSKLTQQEKSALGQKTGMLTRCLVDTTIELMKMHGVKSTYSK